MLGLAAAPEMVSAVPSDLGGAFAQAGHLDEAARHLRRALQLDPTNVTARENLTRLQRRLSQ